MITSKPRELLCFSSAIAAVFLCWGSVSIAADPLGAETREWIGLQTGGSAASPEPRPMPGDIAEKTYDRYAESFTKPIPDELSKGSFIEDSGE